MANTFLAKSIPIVVVFFIDGVLAEWIKTPLWHVAAIRVGRPFHWPFFGLLAWPQWNSLDDTKSRWRTLRAVEHSGLAIPGLTCSAI
jgi:hypothetical protein